MMEYLELDIYLPEADIDGLHFVEQKVKGVFDLQDDGKYHCRNILFLSARNTEVDNSRDILTEYLQGTKVRNAFLAAIDASYGIKSVDVSLPDVSLPTEKEGVKKYNGVAWWYWFRDKYSGSADTFHNSGKRGYASGSVACNVGGCAPVFHINYTESGNE